MLFDIALIYHALVHSIKRGVFKWHKNKENVEIRVRTSVKIFSNEIPAMAKHKKNIEKAQFSSGYFILHFTFEKSCS